MNKQKAGFESFFGTGSKNKATDEANKWIRNNPDKSIVDFKFSFSNDSIHCLTNHCLVIAWELNEDNEEPVIPGKLYKEA